MTSTANAAVNAVHNGAQAEFPAEDYPQVRCALLVYASQMLARKQHKFAEGAQTEVRRLDAILKYDPRTPLQRGLSK